MGRVYLLIDFWAKARPSDDPRIPSIFDNWGREDRVRGRVPEISNAMVKWLDIDLCIQKLAPWEQETVARVAVGKQMFLPRTTAVRLKAIFQERCLLPAP